MATIERIMLAAFGLIFLYIFLNAREAGNVIGQVGQYTGGLFGTLQGANVTFKDVTIARPAGY